MLRFALLTVLAACAAACTPVRSYHGYVLERTDKDDETETKAVEAKIGVDTRESVLAAFGEPSTLSTFDGNVWYYISSRERRYAFFKDKTTWRQIVAIRFDGAGRVASVDQFDLEDGRQLALVSRVTPTKGKELTFLEQIFGNVGQLPAPGAGDVGGPGGPGIPGGPGAPGPRIP